MVIQTTTLENALNAYGITAWRVLNPSDLDEEKSRLKAWLHEGYHADMEWMPRHADKRCSPTLLWEGVQSIVVVVLNYFPGWEAGQGDTIKIARYALGKDYHKIIRRKLAKVLQHLQEEHPDLNGRPFVDSAPLLEKALAVRAGLGWQGKHSLLITKATGSWVMIGTLFLNKPVEWTHPPQENTLETGHCGTCTRCITACPTEAILAPTQVDSRRCIAYWTIENADDALPEAITTHQNGWIFGCDICQDVCPWNIKFSHLTEEPAFAPRPMLQHPQQECFVSMTEEDFEKHFQNSPLRRTGLKRIKRNLPS